MVTAAISTCGLEARLGRANSQQLCAISGCITPCICVYAAGPSPVVVSWGQGGSAFATQLVYVHTVSRPPTVIRYEKLEQDFASRLQECPQTQSGEQILRVTFFTLDIVHNGIGRLSMTPAATELSPLP